MLSFQTGRTLCQVLGIPNSNLARNDLLPGWNGSIPTGTIYFQDKIKEGFLLNPPIYLGSCSTAVPAGSCLAQRQAEDGDDDHGKPQPGAQHDLQDAGLHPGHLHHR